ncbi:MAG TPA: LytR family transcriptional regulator, partial [Streptomyces sp.]
MDGRSRGRADEVDPADQWVLNPHTGDYELRLNHSGSQPPPSARAGNRRNPTRGTRHEVPAQRARRPAPNGREGGRNQAPSPAARRKRKAAAKTRRKKALLWSGGVLAFVIVAGSAGAYALYEKFNSNLDTVDVGNAASKNVAADAPLNILIIGTDK